MPFNILKFLNDYNISYSDSGKNCSEGWVNIQCPICRDNSNHLGFDSKTGGFNCWKGNHTLKEIISSLSNANIQQTTKIISKYMSGPEILASSPLPNRSNKELTTSKCSLPPFSGPLTNLHKDYLKKRNFDPDLLEKRYNLKGTNHLGDWKFRIIIPIDHNNIMVSYIGRDVTSKSNLRYKACPIEKTVIPHKKTLYGIDEVKNDTVIIVEGIFDCWRLNQNNPGMAIALFGTQFTDDQILLIINNFKKISILFDSKEKDKNAPIQANKLASILLGFNKKVEILEEIKNDPAEMNQKEVDSLINRIS